MIMVARENRGEETAGKSRRSVLFCSALEVKRVNR